LGHVRAESSFAPGLNIALMQGVLLAFWMTWELYRLWRTAGSARWWTLWLSLRFRLSTAALVIGTGNAILYSHVHGMITCKQFDEFVVDY